jgi:hypothetical protein
MVFNPVDISMNSSPLARLSLSAADRRRSRGNVGLTPLSRPQHTRFTHVWARLALTS